MAERRRVPPRVGVALALVVVIAAVLAGQLRLGPLDDPDPAFQRPGLLDLASLPQPAPVLDGYTYDQRTTLVIFERADRVAASCAALAADPVGSPAVLLVAGGPFQVQCPVAHIAEADEGLATRFAMRTPRDGGSPVGYAIVDGAGQIRYATLDPSMPALLDEVRTMLGAVEGG